MQVNDHMPGMQPLLPKKGPQERRGILDDDAEALLDERFGKPLLVGIESSLVGEEDHRLSRPLSALVEN
ncbi:hypothetical protein L107_04835 [Cyanobium sp. Copco_Reservoir_LC18]|nr:hypothetical protein L107_04835 [Cyanobium sp. Copco_Reservoir_LC18]